MPRKTSDVTDTQFPFDEDTVPFILVFNSTDEQRDELDVQGVEAKDAERGYATAWTALSKHNLVNLATELNEAGVGCSLLAVWPGAKQSHVFLVDDLDEARVALG